jgi:hypothetical protein
MQKEGCAVMGSGALQHNLTTLVLKVINAINPVTMGKKLVIAKVVLHVYTECQKDSDAQ